MGTGALGVGAEQTRFHLVGLGERRADAVQQSGVGGRVAAARSPDRGLVDRDHPGVPRHGGVDQRALPGTGHPGDHRQHPERDVHVDVAEVVPTGAADGQAAGRRPGRRLEARAVVEVATGQGAAGPQTLDGPGVADLSAVHPGPRPEVDHVVGDLDRLRFVLHHQHRVALVPQPHQQSVHPLDVVRVQADRRLVEHVADVGEAGAEVPDHLGPLGLTARQGARGTVQAEIAETDLHERVQGLLQGLHQRGDRRLVEGGADPVGQVADLQPGRVGDVELADPGRQRGLVQPGSPAVGTVGEGDGPVHESAQVRLQALLVLGQEGLPHPGHQTLVRHVDGRDLHLDRLGVEEALPFLGGVVADRLVAVQQTGLAEDPHQPAVRGVAGHGDGATVQ